LNQASECSEPSEPRELNELAYPSFPWRVFLVIAVIVVLLAAAVIAEERTEGSASASAAIGGCAAAAARVMSANDYSIDMMAIMGPRSVGRCQGLDPRQFGRALLDTYRIEYGRILPKASSDAGRPSAAYRARSAQSALRARG
jgi:hypothetical protein